jgi:hypothetical protein
VRRRQVIQLLLEQGADVTASLSESYGSALAAAAATSWWGKNEPIVRVLLKHEADINMELSGDYKNALEAAEANKGNEDIIQLLKEYADKLPQSRCR